MGGRLPRGTIPLASLNGVLKLRFRMGILGLSVQFPHRSRCPAVHRCKGVPVKKRLMALVAMTAVGTLFSGCIATQIADTVQLALNIAGIWAH